MRRLGLAAGSRATAAGRGGCTSARGAHCPRRRSGSPVSGRAILRVTPAHGGSRRWHVPPGRLRLVGDCVQYALLCRGAIDAATDTLMKPWDIGALAPCVLEAGGSISDLNGESARIVERSSFVAASSAGLRRAICACVGRPRAPTP